jgi:hypothetical protein
LAIISVIISLAISIGVARSEAENANSVGDVVGASTSLLTAGAFAGITVVLLIVALITAVLFFKRRLAFKNAKGIKIFFWIVIALYFVSIIISVAINFSIAAQYEADGKGDRAAQLRTAGFFLPISAVLFFIAILVLFLYVRSQLPKEVRKTAFKVATSDTNDKALSAGLQGGFDQLRKRGGM